MSEETTLDACNCCEGIIVLTPQSLENLPGLAQLAYRVGTHGSFKAAMLSRLPGKESLGRLTTRAQDDPSIAILDAAATLLDVLTFYQERSANEGYLRTAVERGSVLELARAIGYELNPGVAASTFLAFQIQKGPSIPASVTIPVGTRVLSIPGQDELPQPFETTEEIEARPEWNDLRPAQTRFVRPQFGTRRIYLQGVSNNLRPGDGLVIVGDEWFENVTRENWDFRHIKSVQIVPATETLPGHTVVTLEYGIGEPMPFTQPARKNPRVFVFRGRANLFGYNAPDFRSMPENVQANYGSPDGTEWPKFTIRDISGTATGEALHTRYIHLDALYPQITPESFVVLADNVYVELYQVKKIADDAISNFTLSNKASRLLLLGENLDERFNTKVRETLVYMQSEELLFADPPLDDPVAGDHLPLGSYQPDLLSRRSLIVSGRRMRAIMTGTATLKLASLDGSEEANLPPGESLLVIKPPVETGIRSRKTWTLQNRDGMVGRVTAYPAQITYAPALEGDPFSSEPAQIKEVHPIETGYSGKFATELILEQPLQGSYYRPSVSIFANVSPATHGETKAEILGSGDAGQAFQKFVLKHKPLTYISAPTASGAESTLEVRVNDILWTEAPSLYVLGPHDRKYITRLTDDGAAIVQFGDGMHGARLPSGVDNVYARYRIGIGEAGMLQANQLSLLVSRPLGVQKVDGRLAPTGAGDPQVLDDARMNAPFTVLTLDRIVSLQDFEDYTRSFAGIGKAQATWVWNGEQRIVHLTVATASSTDGLDYTLNPASPLYQKLSASIDLARDTTQAVRIDTYLPLFFRVQVTLVIDPTYLSEKVIAAVEQAVRDRYAFPQRSFGQSVHTSDILATVQAVTGVTAAYLDYLYLRGHDPTRQDNLPARRATLIGRTIRQAELLLIDANGITLKEASA
jgi:hypothetical protein